MRDYVRNGLKVLYNYIIVLVIYVIFIYVFLSITQDKFNDWLPLYCILLFIFLFFLLYTDMKALAVKEKRPQYDLHPYPLKGLVYGALGTLPVAVVVAVASLIRLQNDIIQHMKHVAINVFLGPMYFVIRWLHESPAGYAAAILLLPVIAMLGYLAGYYGFNIMDKVKKKKPEPEKKFTKSPWNPSNASGKGTGKRKKKEKNFQDGQRT